MTFRILLVSSLLFALPSLALAQGVTEEGKPLLQSNPNAPDPCSTAGGTGCWPVCGCGTSCGCVANTRGPDSLTPPDQAFATQNVVLLSRVPLQQFASTLSISVNSGSDCWGYVSPSGREYAIMGLNSGHAFVEITDPRNPDIIGFVSKPSSLWGDAAVYQNYAYLVSDQTGNGIQIIDLANIDNRVLTHRGTVQPSGMRTVHSNLVYGDFLYCSGSNLPSNGLVILSLANPLAPTVVGQYTGNYCHDFQIHTYTSGPYAGRTIAFACMGSTALDIVDVTNPAAPFRISRTTYPGLAYNHQAWLDPATNRLYLNDELDERNNGSTPCLTRVFDVSNLSSPQLIGSFSINQQVVDHNNYIRDGFLYQANYRAGLHIFDLRNSPVSPPRTGFFDTYPGPNALEFNGAWSVYPFFPSGNVIVSDIEGGLFVLDPTFALTGGVPLAFSFPSGLPSTIRPVGQRIDFQISGANGGSLQQGSTPTLHIRVGSSGPFTTVTASDLGNGLFRATLPILDCPGDAQFYFSATASSGATVREPLSAPVDLLSAPILSDSTTRIDDTLETNTGWVVGAPGDNATTGIWVRVDPIGTAAQPEDDHTPPPGVLCFVTGQGTPGGPLGENDVDGGTTTLTSPTLDATPPANGDVYLSYWRWYSNNTGAAPNEDTMPVLISNNNGQSWTALETVSENTGVWTYKSFRIADFLSPTSTLKVRFQARDLGSASIVEAGVDDLRIFTLTCTLAGDTNGDGVVNFADLNNVLSTFGQSGPGLIGDVNGDGVVDFLDLNIVLSNFGAGA